MQDLRVAGIILAAGKGTRMKSDLPKGLHRVCGLPMVEHVGRAMKGAGVHAPIVVVGHGGEKMTEALGPSYDFVWQREQLGTGHAALMAASVLKDYKGPVIVAAGDTPMLESDTFKALLESHIETRAKATLATSMLEDPHGYGRIVRNEKGDFKRIVEQKDAREHERQIREVNAALYCFDSETLFRILPNIKNSNSQGEYYLTDVLEAVGVEGGKVVAKLFDNPDLLVGVNDRWQLALVDRDMRRRVIKRHALNGVTFLDIESVSIETDVTIGRDTVIHPHTILSGNTAIGDRCQIGPYTKIANSAVGNDSTILASFAQEATVGNEVWVGPYAHLRPRAVLGNGTKIGNFVEVKNSSIADGAKVSHLSYIGDATIGANTNIGAGTITVNYDGYDKYPTTVGADAFVGCNTALVAPVTVGDRAFVTAGSVITQDVPADAMAFGRARQVNKDGKAAEWHDKKKAAKEQK